MYGLDSLVDRGMGEAQQCLVKHRIVFMHEQVRRPIRHIFQPNYTISKQQTTKCEVNIYCAFYEVLSKIARQEH